MTVRALNDPKPQDEAFQSQLEFPDNRLLIDLFGEFNRNLVQVEEALSVQVVHQGNRLTVFGECVDVGRAVKVLEALHRRLEAGREITPGDIDAEIRMGEDMAVGPPSGQMELFPRGKIEIKTRKKLVEPRTG
ncbi:MAG: phosphate starvation-inducible protein PhoH, partial [Boseongicola sp. SB0670_bin_30]|nr:phosphate starvation-inducible protein PhoH [Boseongicola sp. SB0670_bin_30]